MWLGYVSVYSYIGGNWSLQQTIDGSAASYFGNAVAFSPNGTQLAIGAPGFSDKGM